MTYPENINVIMLIVAIILVLIIFTLSLVQTIRGNRAPIGLITIILLIIGVVLLVPIVYSASEIRTAEWVQIILMIGLVTVTAVYAHSTKKMAKEIEEQRYSENLPLLVPTIPDILPSEKLFYEAIASGVGVKVIWCNVGKGVAINSRFSFWTAPTSRAAPTPPKPACDRRAACRVR